MRTPCAFPGARLGILCALVGVVSVVVGLPNAAWGQTVALKTQVIYAANQPGGVDGRLGTLVDSLQKTFRYSMYQLLDAPSGSAALNQTWRAALPDNRWLEITPTAVKAGQYNLTVRVVGADGKALVNTAVRMRRSSTVLVGGPSHQKGVLIIAITAN